MIKIREVYVFTDKEKNDIIDHFGLEFYHKIVKDLIFYSNKWQLYHFELIPYYSVNCVFRCYSDLYGDAIIKIGKPNKEVKTEINTLKEYNGKRFCQLFDSDMENGVILEEQIKPGTVLWNIHSLEERLNVFCSVYKGLYIETQNTDVYPTYIGWISRITDYMSQRKNELELYHHMKQAKEYCLSLSTNYSKKLLLHGDLHHDNILLGSDGQYRIIDPKGVIGDPVFDIGQFMLNEYNDDSNPELFDKFNYIISYFSENLQIPDEVIRKSFYIQRVMSECWNVEDGLKTNIKAVDFAEKILNKSYNNIKFH